MSTQDPANPIRIDQGATLDLLEDRSPARSATSDVPVVETKPDTAPKSEAPAAPASEEEGKTTSESATEHTEDVEVPGEPAAPAKPPRGVQKRLDELARQREAERERADNLQRMLDRELAARAQPKQEQQPAAPQPDETEPVRPQRTAFTDPEAYAEAVAEWSGQYASWAGKREAQAVIQAERRKSIEAQVAEGQRLAREAYQSRVEKTVEKHADYREVAESPSVEVSIPMAHAILNSEDGPEIQYYLGKNPEEAKRIVALNPALQLVELGKIAAKLAAPAAPTPAAPAKPVSAAPKPIAPIVPTGNAPASSPEEESMDAYAARRKKELQASMRPGARLN